jgi:cytochrome P450
MEARRARPADDLVSGLAAAVTAGQISDQEAVAAGILLLNAGHEATVNASGNGLLALLNTPGQWQMLRDNPALVRSAVEEMLRYDTPLQLFHRWVMEDVEYKGITFRAGERISLLYGAANRDPKKFDHPEQFDITRAENGHITFGSGIHYCLGAPLARLELTVTLQMLLELFPNIVVEGQPEFMPSFVIRGLKELRLRCA